MVKTPGKWIKNLLLGKISSKSNLSKKRDISKSTSKGEVIVSSEVPTSNSAEYSSPISPPTSRANSVKGVDSINGAVCRSLNDGVTLPAMHEDGTVQVDVNLGSQEELGRVRHEQAATKAQAAFRGYLARRAFRILKGIIRFQALIQGHLVRRQAASTLYCVQGIVKFQALVRGHKVRCSDIGLAVHNLRKHFGRAKVLNVTCYPFHLALSLSSFPPHHLLNLLCQGANCSRSTGVTMPTLAEKLSKSVVVHKLVASWPAAIPLRLNYSPGEPNTAWVWLDRWTRSRFWKALPESKKNLNSMSYQKHDNHQTVDTDEGLPKRGASKTSGANAENGSIGSSGSEKSKHNPRKVISHPELSVGKFNSRKIPSSTKEVSDKTEVGKDKRKPIPRKLSGSTAPDVSQQASAPAQKMEVLPVPIPEKSDLNTCPKLQVADEQVDKLHNYPVINLQTTENIGRGEGIEGMNQELNYSDSFISNENAKTCQRRASLPAKFDGQENVVHNTPRLPSYMSPTESAKAKLRGQDSSRLAQDIAEKNVTTRRHSLSSSANGKISSLAPRVPSLVSMNGRGAIRADRSLSSSRDGCDKVVQPEWRR